MISAFLAHPDWNEAFHSMFQPQLSSSPVYWLAVVGTVGTTITPWGQAFIQSYVVDKGLQPEDLPASRVDVFFGALLTNVIAAFIVICCAATLYATGQTTITSASEAAQALAPIAGQAASVLFAVGLLGASFLGLGVVPLTSAYTTCEAFGWETGVEWNWREAPAFYGLLAFFIGFAALFVMIPGLPLIQVMFAAQVLNALLLPFILVFVMRLSADRKLLGPLGERADAPRDRVDGDGPAHRDVADPHRGRRHRQLIGAMGSSRARRIAASHRPRRAAPTSSRGRHRRPAPVR